MVLDLMREVELFAVREKFRDGGTCAKTKTRGPSILGASRHMLHTFTLLARSEHALRISRTCVGIQWASSAYRFCFSRLRSVILHALFVLALAKTANPKPTPPAYAASYLNPAPEQEITRPSTQDPGLVGMY